MTYPTNFENLLIFSAAVGAITGTIAGAFQYWLYRGQSDDGRKTWRKIIDVIAWYPLIWSGLSVAFTPIFVSQFRSYGLSFSEISKLTLQHSLMAAVMVPAFSYLIPKWMDRKKLPAHESSKRRE